MRSCALLTVAQSAGRGGDRRQELIDDVVGAHPAGLGMVVAYDAMPEGRMRHRVDVLGRGEESAPKEGAALGRPDQVLRAPRPDSPLDPLPDEIRGAVELRTA